MDKVPPRARKLESTKSGQQPTTLDSLDAYWRYGCSSDARHNLDNICRISKYYKALGRDQAARKSGHARAERRAKTRVQEREKPLILASTTHKPHREGSKAKALSTHKLRWACSRGFDKKGSSGAAGLRCGAQAGLPKNRVFAEAMRQGGRGPRVKQYSCQRCSFQGRT